MEVEKKETSYLGAIYVDFSKHLSLEESHMSKENLRTVFFFNLIFYQVGVSNVR